MALEDDTDSETAEMLPPQRNRESRNRNTVMFTSSAVMLLGAITSGIVLALSSPLIPAIQNDTSKNAIHITDVEASWIGSLLSVGGIIGGLLAGLVMQAAGRKFTSILSGIPYVGGFLLIAFAVNVWMIYIGRVITGIGLAFTSLVVPTYVGEISTHSLRGLLGSANQLCITLGILLVYGVGGYVYWRWFVLAIACIPTLYVVLCLFIPETPRHLYLTNQRRQSVAVLQSLRGAQADIEGELRDLEQSVLTSGSEASWKELLFDRSIRLPFLITLAAMFFQQMSGINCIMFYAQSIFEGAGFKTASQLHMSLVLVAGIQVIFTFISCVIVDKTGRKVLWVISSALMCVSMVAFGLYFQLTSKSNDGSLNWLALVSLMAYMASFSIGLGPLPWLLMVEILPTRAKGKCGGIATMANLLFCFVITKEFMDLQNALTKQGTFWLFAGICFLSVVFGLVLLPETKGKSLEEIQRMFDNDNENYEEISGSDVKA